MLSKNSKVVHGCLLGVMMSALAYFLWFGSNADNAKTAHDSASLAAVAHYGSASGSMLASPKASHRALAGVPIASSAQVALKQVTLSKAELEVHPKFWMLGYSEQDIGWLTRFGYPTLEEESKLDKATPEQLRALAEAGDLNAQVHLGIRLAQPALMSNDARSLRHAAYMIEQALIDGGPYQAAKTAEFFVNLAKNRRSVDDLNEEQRTALQKELLPQYELAKGISAMYGDFAAVRVTGALRKYDTKALQIDVSVEPI